MAETAEPSSPLVQEQERRIVKLQESVINRIAAGEIIQRPANALKELLENSIDAKATSIEIIVKEGGLKLLQITDNGTGIDSQDLEILCERFTTSKLREFNDLNSMTTYGFRGEALASITHVAHVTVTTKTASAQCAYRGVYSDGRLVPAKPGATADPRPVAGRDGTQITVEDMFYNVPSRKRALNRPNDEYAKIVDVINKYAVHSEGVAFSCKRQGENTTSVSTSSKNNSIDNIRLIYGSSIANELLAFDFANDEWRFRAKGLATNANYHVKKMTLLLFINNRSVESSSIKKALENLYSTFLPKNTHPFVYLALQLDPSRIDVNVHPTKREVHILNEDEIVILIATAIHKRLSETDNSRQYPVQTLLPGAPVDAGISSEKIRRSINLNGPQNPATFVRTDSKQQKIVSMLDPSYRGQKNLDLEASEETTLSGKDRVTIKLASIKELRAEVRASIHEDLTAIFTEHVFVGIIDLESRFCAVQHLNKLYVIDYGAASAELFYQIGLSEFGNFGTIILDPALGLRDLLEVGMTNQESKQADESKRMSATERSEHIESTYTRLYERRDMLREYFSVDITEDGKLCGIPLLLRDYTPSISKLANFLLRLGPNVEWDIEKACFKTFLRELALFYIPEAYKAPTMTNVKGSTNPSRQAGKSGESITGDQRGNLEPDRKELELRRTIETVLFGAFKRRLIATKQLAIDKRINQIAELGQLYKIFERC